MKEFVTVRIYFEFGQKAKNLSIWQRLNFDFATEIIKKAKNQDLDQVLSFNVSKGYFKKNKINWGRAEIKDFNHPQIIEIIDTKEKVNDFLYKEKSFFEGTKVLFVRNEVLLSI